MADIGLRSIGELNIHKVIRGYRRTWKTIHPGDLTSATVSASISNNGTAVPITVSKEAYDSTAKTTTINYTVSAEATALLALGKLTWTMILTESSIPAPYLHGFIEVLDL